MLKDKLTSWGKISAIDLLKTNNYSDSLKVTMSKDINPNRKKINLTHEKAIKNEKYKRSKNMMWSSSLIINKMQVTKQ